MKLFCMLVLGVSFAMGSFLIAAPAKDGCTCVNCKCTPESNCGCLSKAGCSCSRCSCGDQCACGSGCKNN